MAKRKPIIEMDLGENGGKVAFRSLEEVVLPLRGRMAALMLRPTLYQSYCADLFQVK